MKMRFRLPKLCFHHSYSGWSFTYDGEKPVVIFYRCCSKCGHKQSFTVPLAICEGPHREYLRRKKHIK